jgi:hypothetical protein
LSLSLGPWQAQKEIAGACRAGLSQATSDFHDS